VIDLMEALRASIGQKGSAKAAAAPKAEKPAAKVAAIPTGELKERKPAKRAPKVEEVAAPARTRARK
jgi:DNA end-binding protein Ku